MAIVKMNKFTLLAFESEKGKLLKKLQESSKVEFINLQDEEILENNEDLAALLKDEQGTDTVAYEENLSKVKSALDFLKGYVPQESGLKALRAGKESLTFRQLEDKVAKGNWEDVYLKVKEKETNLSKLDNEKTRLQGEIENLTPFKDFDAPLASIKGLKTASCFLGSITKQYEEQVKDQLLSEFKDFTLEVIERGNQETFIFVLVHKDNEEKTEVILRSAGYTPFQTQFDGIPASLIDEFNEQIIDINNEKLKIEEVLNGYTKQLRTLELAYELFYNKVSRNKISTNFLKTEKVVLIQGWLPTEDNEIVTSIVSNSLGEAYYLNFENVKEEEVESVPIKLKNNTVAESFESITEMYSLPKYDEIDPTPLLTPFYLLFFGMMIADIGYGLLLLIATMLALKVFKLDDEKKKFVKFFALLSLPSILFGVIYGSFFGDAIAIPRFIDPNKDINTILLLSVGFGVIQIFFGLAIKAYMLIRDGKPLDALMDVGSWVVSLVGVALFALGGKLGLSPTEITVAKYAMILGMVAIVLTQGRQAKSVGAKLGGGLYALYGITAYVGDLVSYTRLMALGLAGGSIASALNLIIRMFPPGIVAIIATPLVFVAAQVFNMLLSLLGAYVHTCRLQYVEYFSKFYEGGGKAFSPFKTVNQYINLRNNNK